MGGDTAAVLPFDPSQAEEGFLFDQLRTHKLLTADPLGVVGGAWRGLHRIKAQILGCQAPHSDPVPKRVFLPYDGHDHLFLVTDPDPELGGDPDEAANALFKPGLSELADSGSALRLHVAYALRHPEQRVITEATKGMSHTGKTVASGDISQRRIEAMAADSLEMLPRLTRDGATEIFGTSLGTTGAVSIAEQNLAAGETARLDLRRLNLIASAVIAAKIEGPDNFRDPDLDEHKYRHDLSKRFQLHVIDDFIRMSASHPIDILSCWPQVGAYVLAHPRKTYSRLLSMAADYANVKEGTPWESLKNVVEGVDIRVLGGSRDPLIQEQERQWDTLEDMFPGRITRHTVAGMGHLLTAAAAETVGHLDSMDTAVSAELAAAA